jgi:peptidoglycan/LPS O-acetylase OafA/YrhL
MPAMPGVFAHNPSHVVNVSVWTIAYEFRCYALVAVLGLAGAFQRRVIVAALFAAMTAAFLYTTRSGAPALHGASIPLIGNAEFWPPLTTYFMAGAVFRLFRERIPYGAGWFAAAGVAMPLCVRFHLVGLLPIFGAYALLYAALLPAGDTRWATRFGDLSYGIYLYAYPAQQLLRGLFPDAWTPATLSLAALALSATTAALSWRFVERRFLARRMALPEGSARGLSRPRAEPLSAR